MNGCQDDRLPTIYARKVIMKIDEYITMSIWHSQWLNYGIEVEGFFFLAVYNKRKQQVPPVALRAQKNEVFRGLRKYHVSPWDEWVVS